ncbi:MAG: adenosylcobalamin-dependent ribonucleoside-diphosphate reductase, partial [Candidatus Heimdallarchaeaceae archaeon]
MLIKNGITKDQVTSSALDFFNQDQVKTNTWVEKYSLTDGNLFFEYTPDDSHHRCASEFFRIENKYPNPLSESYIFSKLQGFKEILLQGSPFSGIGNVFSIQSISNCYSIGSPEDSYGGILRKDEEIVQICKRRGGVGM